MTTKAGGRPKGVTAETHPSYKNAGRKKKIDPKQSFIEALNEYELNTMDYFARFMKDTWRQWIRIRDKDPKQNKEVWNRMYKLLDTMTRYQFPTPKAESESDRSKDVNNWTIIIGDQDEQAKIVNAKPKETFELDYTTNPMDSTSNNKETLQ